MNDTNEKPTVFLLVMLAALTAFAPFVTDMYLPALPSMTESFNATASQVQLGLTTSMLGLAIGQLIIGPLSDKYGRKVPLISTLILFAISSALCIISNGIAMFVAMRFIQGFGASGGVVSTALYLNASPWLFEICLFAMMGSFGLILAPSTAIAMNAARKQAGLASAILGAAGFLSGGIASPVVGLGNIQITTGIVFISSALLTFIIITRIIPLASKKKGIFLL